LFDLGEADVGRNAEILQSGLIADFRGDVVE
jgi:hypothetical protein